MSFWSERTLRRSFACAARKMRCLRLRTIRSALRQSMAFQSVPVCPLGPFTAPERCIQLFLWLASFTTHFGWLTRPTSAAFQPESRGLVSARLWIPLAFRRAAFASWVFLCPLRVWAFLPKIVRLTDPFGDQTASGLSRSAPVSSDGDGCLLYCEGCGVRVCDVDVRTPGPCPNGGMAPCPFITASAIACDDRDCLAVSSEVHSRSPFPSFPCLAYLDGSGSP